MTSKEAKKYIANLKKFTIEGKIEANLDRLIKEPVSMKRARKVLVEAGIYTAKGNLRMSYR